MKASQSNLHDQLNAVRAKTKLNGITGDWQDTANFSTADDEVNNGDDNPQVHKLKKEVTDL